MHGEVKTTLPAIFFLHPPTRNPARRERGRKEKLWRIMSSSTPNKRLHEESASTEFHPLPFDQNKLPLHHQMYPSLLDKTTTAPTPPVPAAATTTWKEQHTLLEDAGLDRKKNRDSPSTLKNDHTVTTTDHETTPLPDATPKRKERDVEIDTDRHEKRTRSDDGYMDADGPTDREAFNSAVQQRKRMPRPRGSPQVHNRFRSRSKDNEESQDKPEVSTVVYKVGECMQELIKLWKDWDQDNKFGETSPTGPTLEVRIPAEYVTATNRQVRGGQLWGTEVYTDDSDLVAVLMHSGYCRPTASPPPSAIQELRATIRVLPPQNSYTSTLRNNVRSRAWGAAIGCSYCVEHCCIVKKGGGTIDLEPCLTHTSSVEPTLAPVAVERTMTTRAAASNALRQQRFVREVTIQYNLCNEPWIKYSISIVADKGLKKPFYTSARLKKGEVLYLETHSHRYELCYTGEKAGTVTEGESSITDQNELVDVFRWSRCKKPLPQKMMSSIGIPLSLDYIEVVAENIEWEDVQWSQTGVLIAGKEYPLARVHFLSPN